KRVLRGISNRTGRRAAKRRQRARRPCNRAAKYWKLREPTAQHARKAILVEQRVGATPRRRVSTVPPRSKSTACAAKVTEELERSCLLRATGTAERAQVSD